MGKGSKAPAAPDPYKTASTEAQFNRLDTYGPSGSGTQYGYTDASGNFVRGLAPQGQQAAVKQTETEFEKQIRQMLEPASVSLTGRIVNDNINGMPDAARVKDRGSVAQSIFDRNYSMMKPTIDKNNDRLLTNLQARGLPVGGEAFNEAYGNQQRETQDTISRLAQDADINAGNEQSRQFGLDASARSNSIAELVAAMGGGYNPPTNQPSGSAPGVNYSGLVGQKYQADMANYNSQQQQQSQTAGALGSLGGALLMKSDRRLKTDVRRIGNRGRLPLYTFRYLWDEASVVRVGFMAQEVLNDHPQAVVLEDGFFAVDYAQLPEVA
jgi:Chaperone of endosialidase